MKKIVTENLAKKGIDVKSKEVKKEIKRIVKEEMKKQK